MKRNSPSVRAEKRSETDINADAALAAIREQFLRLDPDEQRVLRRIVRQAERLDLALADLHLVLPVVEICFYGTRANGNTSLRLTPQRLRKLLRRWAVADRRDPHSESSG
jgi:hypothetical protein